MSKADEARAIVAYLYCLEQQDEHTSVQKWDHLLKQAKTLSTEYPRYKSCIARLGKLIYKTRCEVAFNKKQRPSLSELKSLVAAISRGLQEP